MSDGAVRTLHAGKGNYKALAFDEAGRQLAFLSDQAEYDKDVSPYRLYYWKAGDAAATELVVRHDAWHAAGPGGQRSVRAAFSKDGAAALSRHRAAARAARARGRAGSRAAWISGTGRIRCSSRCSACARSRSAIATTARSCISPTSSSSSWPRPDMPNVNPGDDRMRALGTSDLPYRQQVSWDTSYSDIVLVDLKTGQREARSSSTPQRRADDVAGRQVPALFRRDAGRLVHLPHRRRRPRQPDREARRQFLARGSRHAEPAARLRHRRLDRATTSVLLYDKYDIWEIRPDGTGARMVTGGEGRKQQIVFRYRALDPEQRAIPIDKPLLLSANDDRTRGQRLLPRQPDRHGTPEKVVMLRQVVRRSHQGEERRPPSSSRCRASTSSRICGSATRASAT